MFSWWMLNATYFVEKMANFAFNVQIYNIFQVVQLKHIRQRKQLPNVDIIRNVNETTVHETKCKHHNWFAEPVRRFTGYTLKLDYLLVEVLFDTL